MYSNTVNMGCCPEDNESTTDEERDQIRTCTDVFWLCMFLIYWILMILIACFAFVYGNPLRLIHGCDSFGNTCGLESNDKIGELGGTDFSKKKFLFYMDFTNLRSTVQICVEMCPDKNLASISDLEKFYKDTGSFLCRYDINLTQFQSIHYFPPLSSDSSPANIDEIISSSNGPCPVFPIYKSSPVLNRCIPNPAKEISSYFISNIYEMLNSWDFLEKMLSDLYETWNSILLLSLLSLILSLVMISLMYLVAGLVSRIIGIVVSVAAFVSAGIFWWTYFDIKCALDYASPDQILDKSVKNEEAFLWFAVISSIITMVLIFAVFVVWKRIPFLTSVFKESSNCLANIPELYILPILTFSLLITFYMFCISVIVCLATASSPSTRIIKPYSDIAKMVVTEGNNLTADNRTDFSGNISIGEIKTFTVIEYIDSVWVNYMWFVYIVGLIWISEFILACQQIVISGAVAKWYFNRERCNSRTIVITSLGNLVAYHLGSAALGSFLIFLFKVPRLILTYFHNRLKKSGNDSSCVNCTVKCCNCCFFCWEKFVKYMNHNAYTVVAVQGISFCPAAYRAWQVMDTNALKLATINSAADLLLFLGKCIVVACTVSIAVLIFSHNPNLHFYAVPSFIVFIFSSFIAHSVILLYELVIDTLFLCICEDQEMNGDVGYWKTSLLCGSRSPNSVALQEDPSRTRL